MGSLAVENVGLRIVCNGQELKVQGSKFLTELKASMRLRSPDSLEQTIESLVREYAGTNTQFSIVPCYGSTCNSPDRWIITPRKLSPGLPFTNVKGYSKPTDTSYLDAVLREFEEETGSTIDPSFFYQETPITFCLNLDASAKAVLDANFEAVKPATEIYGWAWGPPSASSQAGLPCPGTLVMASDIKQSAVTQAVLAAKAKLAPSSKTTAEFPEPNPGETLNDYINRVTQDLPPATKALARNFGRKKGLIGGRTIRRKKSKRSKKRGTLTQGVRR